MDTHARVNHSFQIPPPRAAAIDVSRDALATLNPTARLLYALILQRPDPNPLFLSPVFPLTCIHPTDPLNPATNTSLILARPPRPHFRRANSVALRQKLPQRETLAEK